MADKKHLLCRKAFTLVELLVVIAIISVLAGLLLPALEDAISASRSIACMNRQRQFGLAIETYRSDNRSCFPVRGYMGMDFLTQIGPYIDPGQEDYTNSTGMWHVNNDAGTNMFLCPGHHYVPGSHSNVIYGSWPPYIKMAHISSWRVFNYAISHQFGSTSVYVTPGVRRNVQNAARVAMLTGQAGSGGGLWADHINRLTSNGIYPHQGQSTNYLFADNHVSNVGNLPETIAQVQVGDILLKPENGW